MTGTPPNSSPRNWSELPSDVLLLISGRLKSYKDYIRLKAVCKPWRHLFFTEPFRQSFPWLMLPCYRRRQNGPHGGVRGCPEGPFCRCFHDVVTNEFHHIDFPLCFSHCRGSGFGWLAFTGDYTLPGLAPGCLINPITRRRIVLPSGFTTRSNGLEYHTQKVAGESVHLSSVQKIVMSSDPTVEGCIVMSIFNFDPRRLGFCKPGSDSKWTALVPQEGKLVQPRYDDGVFWRNQFYVVDGNGNVRVIDHLGFTLSSFLATHQQHRDKIQCRGKRYLVVHPSTGELMMVWRKLKFVTTKPLVIGTKQFMIFKLRGDGEVLEQGRKWELVQGIGDYALFVGTDGATFVSAADYPGCKVNCIYFADEYNYLIRDTGRAYNDIGVYDIKRGCVESLHCTSLYDDDYVVDFWSASLVWMFPCIS